MEGRDLVPSGGNSSCTEWQVKVMINEAIKEYDGKQDQRHRENSDKLDRNARNVNDLRDTMTSEFTQVRNALALEKTALVAQQSVDKYKQWFFPVLLSVLTIIIEAIHLFKN
jgi:predicted phage gp36 major capsid-like protein